MCVRERFRESIRSQVALTAAVMAVVAVFIDKFNMIKQHDGITAGVGVCVEIYYNFQFC